MRDSFVFYRRLDREPPRASRAEGVWMYDANGRKYIDASGGPICVNVGHGRQEIVRALTEQAGRAAYVHGPMFTTDVIEGLAKHAPPGIEKFYFCSSGCEALKKSARRKSVCHFPDTYNGIIHIYCLNGNFIPMDNRRRGTRTAVVTLD